MQRQVHLLFNPNAGKFVRGRISIDRLANIVSGQGYGVELRPVSETHRAARLAAEASEAGAAMVLVAGGDGTINEAVNGLVGTATPLAVLPAGTGNVLASELRLPRDPGAVAARLSTYVPRRIAAGLIRPTGAPERYFLMMAGAGLDAEIIGRVNQGLKNRFGKLAFWFAGWSLLGRSLPMVQVESAKTRRETGFALASRVRNYGGDLEIATGASLLKDDFEVVTFDGASTFPYVFYLAGVLARKATSMPGVHAEHLRAVRYAPANGRPLAVQVDGEPAGRLPATIEIVPDALTLMMPPEFAG